MTSLDKAALVRRLELIAKELRDNVPGSRATALARIDALADDVRKDLLTSPTEAAAATISDEIRRKA